MISRTRATGRCGSKRHDELRLAKLKVLTIPYQYVANRAILQLTIQVMKRRPKLCVVTTAPIVVQFFLLPHLRQLVATFDVTLVANRDCGPLLGDLSSTVRMVVVPVERQISPWNDIVAVVQLFRLFRSERFEAVVSVAPKAGLVAMLAGFMAHTRYRCHIFQGEVWASRTGLMRMILRGADKVIATTATEVLVVSASEREFLIEDGILTRERSAVLGGGSICGVDTTRFAPNPAARKRLREQFDIPETATLVLFLGRLHREKGVLDLVTAWVQIAGHDPSLHLAIIGPDEDELVPMIRTVVGSVLASRLHFCGLTREPEIWMAASDILCLPSYREGFGNVIIEAGATEVPVIASRIYGIADALIENVTGLAHEPGDCDGLAKCLSELAGDPQRRTAFGQAARSIVIKKFEQSRVIERYADHFGHRCNVGPEN